MIRASTLATEEIRKVYDADGPIHGLFGRADVGMLLAEIDALRRELASVGATTAPLYTSQEREALLEQIKQARAKALREASAQCRKGTSTGSPGWSFRTDCAEEIDALIDEEE
jgi:hypothetical protein